LNQKSSTVFPVYPLFFGQKDFVRGRGERIKPQVLVAGAVAMIGAHCKTFFLQNQYVQLQ
jgi:hypothetical protein